MKLTLALTPALLLAGTAMAAPSQAPSYNAAGAQPRWHLTIEHGSIRYVGDNGRTRIATRAPAPRIGFAGEMYTTRRISINVAHAQCELGGATYRDRVSVTVRGRTMHGCGGRANTAAPLPPYHGPGVASLEDSAWTIVSVDGVPAATARPTSIRFSNGRVEGNAGCNSFGGDYRQRGTMLDASRIISTKMACIDPGMQIERKVFHILTGPAQLSFRNGQTLIVSANGSSMTLTRERWTR